jgi:glycosyltransferase involved in cell wall biosynthesis
MSVPSVGVVYVCVGQTYSRLALLSINHLRQHGYRGAIRVVTDSRSARFGQLDCEVLDAEPSHTCFASRHYKTQLHRFAFETTLFLDADAVPIAPVGHIWRELRFADLCMSLDLHPSVADLIARSLVDRERRSRELEHMSDLGLLQHPLYSSGVMLFRQTPQVERVFDLWHEEWARFGHEDQLALVRALANADCAVHTLSSRWNAHQGCHLSVEAARSAGVRILHLRPRLKAVPDSLVRQARQGGRLYQLPSRRRRKGRRLKVLVCCRSFFPRLGGLEAFVERVIDQLHEHCDVGLASHGQRWFPGDKSIPRFEIAPRAGRDAQRRWREAARLFRDAIAQFQPDIVHFASAREAVYGWALRRRIPAVATIHGNDLTDARPASVAHEDPTPLIVQSLNACHRVFPTGRYTASLALEWGVTAPLSVHPPGCDFDFFQPRHVLGELARATFGIPEELPMILTVARLVPRKGHLSLLEAIRQLPFEARWVVVGDGRCRSQLEEAIAERGMQGRVVLLGKVPDDDLLGLYNACDVFAMTPHERVRSRWLDSEGFGLVFHEAGACGKPVVASDISGCRESIVDGRTGLLVPPEDPQALSRALAFVLTNPHEAERLGHCGLEAVRSMGGWARLARSLAREYADIVALNGLRADARYAGGATEDAARAASDLALTTRDVAHVN